MSWMSRSKVYRGLLLLTFANRNDIHTKIFAPRAGPRFTGGFWGTTCTLCASHNSETLTCLITDHKSTPPARLRRDSKTVGFSSLTAMHDAAFVNTSNVPSTRFPSLVLEQARKPSVHADCRGENGTIARKPCSLVD